MPRTNTYPSWAILFATLLVLGLIIASAYFFVVLSHSGEDTTTIADNSSSTVSSVSSSTSTSAVSSSQSNTAGVVLRTSIDCSDSITYDPNVYSYEDGSGFRNYFGANTKGSRLFIGGSKEVLIECGQITSDQDSNSLLESLQQNWFNEGINYTYQIINPDYQIDGRSSIELDLSYTDSNGSFQTERIFVVAAPEKVLGYVIRVTDNDAGFPDSFASEILPSVKLIVGV